jgi:hypothetical protein
LSPNNHDIKIFSQSEFIENLNNPILINTVNNTRDELNFPFQSNIFNNRLEENKCENDVKTNQNFKDIVTRSFTIKSNDNTFSYINNTRISDIKSKESKST